MTVTLKTLLHIAPFSPEKRDELLKVYDQLSPDQIERLSRVSWDVILQSLGEHIEFEQKKIALEVEEGKRVYNQSDFEEVRARLTHELMQKFEKAGEKIELADVREELSKYQSKPLKQDKVIN